VALRRYPCPTLVVALSGDVLVFNVHGNTPARDETRLVTVTLTGTAAPVSHCLPCLDDDVITHDISCGPTLVIYTVSRESKRGALSFFSIPRSYLALF
jgi:hypothetical protein